MRDPICIYGPGKNLHDAIPDPEKLLTDEVLAQNVVVISIAGRYRQGKSFLMNNMIKYLRAEGASDWLESETDGGLEGFEGFEWRHTRHAVTKGVLIWPEIFKFRKSPKKEVVVILMDTQGVFDTKTPIKECTSIFSLSVLLSSIQIFNIKQNIQGDDLGNLQLFTEYGRLISSESSDNRLRSSPKPFQDLIFLVRDWSYPGDNPFGWDGGEDVLREELENLDVKGELATQRASIKSSFEDLKCYLMPHPGEVVDCSDDFRGQVSHMKPEFVQNMKSFIEDVFRPENMKTKRIHGKEITLRDFIVFIEHYVRELESDTLPTPKSLYDATVSAANSAVVKSSFEMYTSRISSVIYTEPREPSGFDKFHDEVYSDVHKHFNEATKMGGEKGIAAALKDLNKRIATSKEHFRLLNSALHDRKYFEARTEEVKAEQNRLRDLVMKLGDETGELSRKLAAAEAKQLEFQTREEEARKELRALEEENKKSLCNIM